MSPHKKYSKKIIKPIIYQKYVKMKRRWMKQDWVYHILLELYRTLTGCEYFAKKKNIFAYIWFADCSNPASLAIP